jgi:hypothetical protein
MVRYRGKKALYEVMSQIRPKAEESKLVERLHPQTSKTIRTAAESNPVANEPKPTTRWWKKPRIVQLISGRIEFSMSYQVAVVVALGLVFVLLVSYQLGKYSGKSTQSRQQPAAGRTTAGNNSAANSARQPATTNTNRSVDTTPATPSGGQSSGAAAGGAVGAATTGNNVIVLAWYSARRDLEPAKEYFNNNGIATDIVLENGVYYLQTTNTYDSLSNPNSEGYKVKARIAELGKNYKAPSGYESFGANKFSDAYGKKIR